MPSYVSTVDGGLVDTRDPSALAPGELIRTDDAEYLPDDPALYHVGGRTKFNATPEASAILALVGANTANGGAELIAAVGTTYRKAAAALTGTFTTLISGLTGGSTLNAIHMDRHVLLMNGVDRNRVYGPDFAAGGFHGMLESATAPTIDRDAGAGTGFTLSTGRKVRYWVEARFKAPDGTILKRAATLAPPVGAFEGNGVALLSGDGSLDKPRINRPAGLDPEMTHWAVFRTATDGEWPSGAEVGEAPFGTSFIDDLQTGTNPGLPDGDGYETSVVTYLGLDFLVSRHGLPPISSTGDIFAGSALTNDVNNPEIVRWSFPGKLHAFPAHNFLHIGEGLSGGTVKLIRTVGPRAIICLDNGVWTLEALPAEDASIFRPQGNLSRLTGADGCISSEAAALFNFNGRLALAYVTPTGHIVVTDGEDHDKLNEDFDLLGRADFAQASKFVLRDNPTRRRLELEYVPKTETEATRTAFFSYDSFHLKRTQRGIRAKASGPATRKATAIASAPISGIERMFYARSDGHVYVEDEGLTDASGTTPAIFDVETADHYLARFGNLATLDTIYVHHSEGESGQMLTTFAVALNTGRAPRAYAPRAFVIDFAGASAVSQGVMAEGHRIRITGSGILGTFGINFLALDFQPVAPARG